MASIRAEQISQSRIQGSLRQLSSNSVCGRRIRFLSMTWRRMSVPLQISVLRRFGTTWPIMRTLNGVLPNLVLYWRFGSDRIEKQPPDLAAARQTTSYFGDRTLAPMNLL